MTTEGHNIPLTEADELAWRAFRYLHGELTAVEAEAFEEDLAIEQPAREALAEAVRLTATLECVAPAVVEGVSGVGPVRVAPRRDRSNALPGKVSRRQVMVGVGIVGAGLAACLAIAVTLSLLGRLRPGEVVDRGPTDPGQSQAALAEAWAGIGDAEIVQPEYLASHSAGLLSDDEDRLDSSLHGQETESGVPSVPSWLLAALDPQQAEMPDSEEYKEIKQ
jgi:hypothetical protein